MINESNQNDAYVNFDEDPSLHVDVPTVNPWGIPAPKTRKQWYHTNNPQVRSYITGSVDADISGKGAKSLQRAADEYQHLSEEFARRGYSSKAMSRKYDNFNGIDSSLLDLALENENNKLNTYQDQFNSEKINERQFNRLQQKQQRRINNLNNNYNTLAEISANKRGIPLVRTQSSVSPAPFVLGTVGMPLAVIGGITGGVAAAPYIAKAAAKAAPYIAKAMSKPWVMRTATGLDVVDTGVSLASGNYLGAAANWIPYDKVWKAGKRAFNAGHDLLKVGASKVSDLGKKGKQLLSNIPSNSSSKILDSTTSLAPPTSAVTPQVPVPILKDASSPDAWNGDMLPPFLRNPNRPPGPAAEISNHTKIDDMPNQPSDIKVNDELTNDFLEFVNSNSNAPVTWVNPFTGVAFGDPYAVGAFYNPFAKQFYISKGIDPKALTPEVMERAENIAKRSAMDAFYGVKGTIAYPTDFGTTLHYFHRGPNNSYIDGDPTGKFIISRADYFDEYFTPAISAHHSDMISSLKPHEKGISEALYNSAIKYAKLRGNSKGVVSGEVLLSPEATTHIWTRYRGKTHMGNFGKHYYGNGTQLDGSRIRPRLIQGADGTWRLTKRVLIENGPVYLLHQPTYDLPVKVGNILDPERIVRKNGKLELTPLNLKSNDLYKVLAPITGGAAGTYFTFGNNNNQ